MPHSSPLTFEGIETAISTLRQIQKHIEAVRKDFFPEDDGATAQISSEVAQFHLRREMLIVERQIRETIILAFGEGSRQAHRLHDMKWRAATSSAMKESLRTLDSFIFELEQKRLHAVETSGRPLPAGVDLATDLYTADMLMRFLDHEIAWSRRHGDPFGVLLLRLPHVSNSRFKEALVKELVVSMACVLKTCMRGYDIACRLKEDEFAVVLRQTNALGVTAVARRIASGFHAATMHLLPQESIMEWTSAIYPFDAEEINGLFSFANSRWTSSVSEGVSQVSSSVR